MPLVLLLGHADAERRRALAARLTAAGHTEVSADAAMADAIIIDPQTPSGERERLAGRLPGVPVLVAGPEDVTGLLSRLAGLAAPIPRLRLGDAVVDLSRRAVSRAGHQSSLTEKEATLLAWLAARPGQAVSRGELLENVWGYHRDTATRTVDITVRRLRSKIEEDPASPRFVVTVRGEGYRFVAPEAPAPALSAPALSATTAPPPASATPASASSARVPAPPPRFRGRDAVLAQLEGLLAGGRVVTLLGPAGVGKTSLALAAAQRTAALFCDLSSSASAGDVLRAAAEALRLPLEGLDGGSVGRALAHAGPLLVVLDNFEQLTAWAAQTVGAWAAEAPEARFLVTSRTRLRLPGEICLDLAPLAAEDATALLLEAARSRQPDFARSPGDDASVRAVAALLEGLPLAIEMAAGRARMLTAAALRSRLERSLDLLRDEHRPARQATLDGALAWSWELLSDAERRALLRLTTLRGDFTLDAAGAVLGGDALELVERLLDCSLARTAPPAAGEMRFALYVSVREYAARRLTVEERASAELAHARWFAEVGARRSAAADGPEGWSVLAACAADRSNTLAAASRVRAREPALAAALLAGLAPLWDSWGASGEDREQLASLVEGLGDGADAETLRGLVLALEGGGAKALAAAEPLAARCLTVAAAEGDPGLEARCRVAASRVAFAAGRHDEANELLLQAREQARGREPAAEVRALMGLSDIVRVRIKGDSEAPLQEALALARAHDLSRLKTTLRDKIARTCVLEGRYSEALGLLEAALATYRDVGDRRGAASALLSIGIAHCESGDYARSVPVIREALDACLSLGDRTLSAYAEYHLGRTLCTAGDQEEALPVLRSAARRADASGATIIGAMARKTTGYALLLLNRFRECDAALGPALASFHEQGNTFIWSEAMAYRGRARTMDGRPVEGAADLIAALGTDDIAALAALPRRDYARLFLSMAWHLSGDAERALALARAYPNQEGGVLDYLNVGWRAFLLAEAGALDEARACFAAARAEPGAREEQLRALELRLRLAEGEAPGDVARDFAALAPQLVSSVDSVVRPMIQGLKGGSAGN